MRKKFIISLLVLIPVIAFSQKERQITRQGNRMYEKNDYQQAETEYNKALNEKKDFVTAQYNLGNALYKQGKYDKALQVYESLKDANLDKKTKAKVLHNLGNSYFNMKKYPESIQSYMGSLKINPKDNETKTNLAIAQKYLIQQQQQQQQQKQDQKSDQKKDDKQQQQQPKDQQDKEKEKEQQQQQQPKVSKQDAQRMLNAVQDEEKQTQDKVKKQQVQPVRNTTDKNW